MEGKWNYEKVGNAYIISKICTPKFLYLLGLRFRTKLPRKENALINITYIFYYNRNH